MFSQQDTTTRSVDSLSVKKKERTFSPYKASFYSAVLPGLGQIYNRKYWKLPILYGGIAGMSYAIAFNGKYYKKYSAAYRDFIIKDPNNKSYLEFLPPIWDEEDLQNPKNADWFQNALGNKKDYYRRYRDLSVIGMVLLYVLNIADASVDAHLSTFDISDDLSLKIDPVLVQPDPLKRSGLGVRLSLKFY